MFLLIISGCRNLLDIVVVVDGSDSISKGDYMKLKAKVADVVGQLEVSEDEMHLGVVLFSSSVMTIPISYNKAALRRQILSLPHPREGTNTALALETMRQLLDLQGRTGVPKAGLVITDGISIEKDETVRQAMRAKQSGITMFAVGDIYVFHCDE